MDGFSRYFIICVTWLFMVAMAAVFFSMTAHAQGRPQCIDVLNQSWREEVANGNVGVSVKNIANGVTRVDYLNKKDGTCTEYFLIADYMTIDYLNMFSVYGPCMLNSQPATLYYRKWLVRPDPETQGWINAGHSSWVYQIHGSPNSVRSRAANSACPRVERNSNQVR